MNATQDIIRLHFVREEVIRGLRLPRDVSGDDLAAVLADLGYQVTRQTGSHLRLTTLERGEHHISIPRHAALRVGTLAGLLGDVVPTSSPGAERN
jgi:predicted RNA binding protein YcfA (HicA-like mRNA interferase family)